MNRNKMKMPRTMGMAVFAAVMAAVSASAASVPVTSMSLDSDFVVGYVDGKLDNANPRSEMAAAQRLLDLAKGLTSIDTKTTTPRRGEVKIETLATYYANTATEYSGLFAGPMAGSSRAAVLMASPVPEPSTYVAGALMLVPLGVGLLRKARKNRAA
jgi:hypothetical protein